MRGWPLSAPAGLPPSSSAVTWRTSVPCARIAYLVAYLKAYLMASLMASLMTSQKTSLMASDDL